MHFRLLLVCLLGLFFSSAAVRATKLGTSAERCESWIRAQQFRPQEPGRLLVVSPSLACFAGEIEAQSAKPLIDWLSNVVDGHTHPLLVVRSGGGDAAVGIDVMGKLQASNAAVRVVDLCASSCADYFFAGAKERSVTDGALLLFHGGYSEENSKRMLAEVDKLRTSGKAPATVNWDETRQSVLADMQRMMARQDALYTQIGVDDAIVHGFDRINADAIDETHCDPTRSGSHDFLFFTVPQLTELGVRIERGRPASDPIEVNRKIRQTGASFEACGLPDLVFEQFTRKPA